MITKEDIDKKKEIIGYVEKEGKPYLKIISSKWECPSCGTIITTINESIRLKEPSRCSCGRRGGFKILDKEVIEAQDLLVMEKDTNFVYKVYLTGRDLIDKQRNPVNGFRKFKGIIKDEYKPSSAKGEFVLYVEEIDG
jgi:DNA replicative helicase MCM subunit Mcm2 (Cdc46/Mcm family)